MTGTMTRGQLARASGINNETILYFEKSGVLPPAERTDGGHRRYDQRHLTVLALVSKARGLGFTPEEVRTLIKLGAPDNAPCDEVRALTEARLDLIRKKIANLKTLETLLASALGQCSGGRSTGCAVVDLLVGR